MSYNVIPTLKFKKQARRLARKYPSLRDELVSLESELIQNPFSGNSLAGNIFKVRLAVKSKGRGKSGGMRVITYVLTRDNEIYLLTIYDKSEQDSLDNNTIRELIKEFVPGK
jgi:mRNA-degrading endonuclease RelE of RelBE toxin-antitoxin system